MIRYGNLTTSFLLTDATEITRGGTPATAQDIKLGMQIRVTLDTTRTTATRVDIVDQQEAPEHRSGRALREPDAPRLHEAARRRERVGLSAGPAKPMRVRERRSGSTALGRQRCSEPPCWRMGRRDSLQPLHDDHSPRGTAGRPGRGRCDRIAAWAWLLQPFRGDSL